MKPFAKYIYWELLYRNKTVPIDLTISKIKIHLKQKLLFI